MDSLNLLMLSGDRDIAQGKLGPFHVTLGGLAPHFDRIDVITPPSVGASFRSLHGNVFVHPSLRSRWSQSGFISSKAAELISKRLYSLVVSHDFGRFYNGMAAQNLKSTFGIPFVSEIHHVPGHPRAANATEMVLKLLTRWYVQWVRSEVQAFRVVNRKEMPALLASWDVPADRILTLSSAYLDFEVFHPKAGAPARWDVVFCGRLVPNKGLDLLAKAAGIVATIRPQTKFLVIGEGPETPGFKRDLATAGALSNFSFAGWLPSQKEVSNAYSQSKMLICTSYNEGLPRVCLEAMACGTPVVSTPVGIMPEVVRDGLNGRIVQWDAREIASAVLNTVGDPETRSSMGALSVEAVRPLARDITLERYAAAYRELALINSKRLAA
ncbi:MAG: glycosyltransferase [Chloroflexi bacterium]|nr:glycosyltransferase [Chloroflexota bacterium]MCY3938081.1 glycosyltransferase [Chloroflexota bacterium]